MSKGQQRFFAFVIMSALVLTACGVPEGNARTTEGMGGTLPQGFPVGVEAAGKRCTYTVPDSLSGATEIGIYMMKPGKINPVAVRQPNGSWVALEDTKYGAECELSFKILARQIITEAGSNKTYDSTEEYECAGEHGQKSVISEASPIGGWTMAKEVSHCTKLR